jgi:hypothetical protein
MGIFRRRDDTSLDDLDSLAAVLDGAGIRFWLDSGTLLGVVRDGALLANDPDIDLAMWTEDAPAFEDLVPRFRELGYRVRAESYEGRVFNYTLIPPIFSNRKRVDIYVYHRHAGYAWAPALQPVARAMGLHSLNPIRAWWLLVYLVWVLAVRRIEVTRPPWAGYFRVKTWWVPADYFRGVVRHASGNPIPAGWEEYLALRYGDWTRPVQSWSFWTDDGALRAARPETVRAREVPESTT